MIFKSYFEAADRHDVFDPKTTLILKRPKHVLYDPDDQITIDNVSHLCNTRATSVQHLPQRRRGPRFLTYSGRGSYSRSLFGQNSCRNVNLSLRLEPSGPRKSLSPFHIFVICGTTVGELWLSPR
ncbi:jg9528 [Pararge aegeria aegeria]|uniref:Jg9528 protein n=1 Tax=Pararge aegeria aegeria TaxID=348720 RepID=A0A8S4RIH7_9NEOP|nr:jg9528 [Pararge aegeria aegeria]